MPGDSTYTAYGRLNDEYLGTDDEDDAEDEGAFSKSVMR
jgi:hypothetical protein